MESFLHAEDVRHPLVSVREIFFLAPKCAGYRHCASEDVVDKIEAYRPEKGTEKAPLTSTFRSLKLFWTSCLPARPSRKDHPLVRDWANYPAVLRAEEAPQDIWAMGDVHADYDRAVKLLTAHGLVYQGEEGLIHWKGGAAHLVQTGDLIDKGPKNLATVDLFRRLEHEAKAVGGRVVVTMGNHEVDLLANPKNAKAIGPGGITWEFWRAGLTARKATAAANPRGLWWRQMPLAYVVRGLLFSHAGQTSGRSQNGLNDYLQYGLTRDGYHSPVVKDENSIVRARNFYGSEQGEQGPRLAKLAHVDTLVFGHDPQSLAPWGEIILFGKQSLIRLDTGLSRGVGFSHGEILHVHFNKKGERHLFGCGPDGRSRRLHDSAS